MYLDSSRCAFYVSQSSFQDMRTSCVPLDPWVSNHPLVFSEQQFKPDTVCVDLTTFLQCVCYLSSYHGNVESNTRTGFLQRWLMPQSCQGSEGIWITPSVICFNIWPTFNTIRQLDSMLFVGSFQLNYSTLSQVFKFSFLWWQKQKPVFLVN